jgi:hypothetical protein
MSTPPNGVRLKRRTMPTNSVKANHSNDVTLDLCMLSCHGWLSHIYCFLFKSVVDWLHHRQANGGSLLHQKWHKCYSLLFGRTLYVCTQKPDNVHAMLNDDKQVCTCLRI